MAGKVFLHKEDQCSQNRSIFDDLADRLALSPIDTLARLETEAMKWRSTNQPQRRPRG